MSDSVIVRVTRPYQSVDEYLDREAWTIDARGMFLIDAPALARNTPIRFVVGLASGEQLIRAEGVARDHVVASPRSPAGLRVWFKRFGVGTKQIIDRAVAMRAARPGSPTAALPRTQSTADLPQVVEAEVPSSIRAAASPKPEAASSARPVAAGGGRKSVPSSAGSRVLAPPTNREELLGRLRARAQGQSLDDLLARSRR